MMGLSLNLNVSLGMGRLVDDGGAGLPPGAIAYADFKNGTYHYGGNALEDFLTENTDWGTFDQNNVVAGVGLQGNIDNTASPVLAPALTTALLASGFIAVEDLIVGTGGGSWIERVDLPDYTQEVFVAGGNGGPMTLFAGSAFGGTVNSYELGVHRLAARIHDVSIDVSIDGDPVDSQSQAAASIANAIGMQPGNGSVIEKIVFYPVDYSDLQTLSAVA